MHLERPLVAHPGGVPDLGEDPRPGEDDPRLAAEPKLAVVMGTEGDGLAGSTIAHCDYTVMIPMSHGVDSLNVAAASAVAFYQLGLMSQPDM